MTKGIVGAAVAAAMVMPGMAAANSQADMEEALRLLEAQVSALKAQMAEMKDVQEQSTGVPDWVNNVEFSGAFEFDYIDADNAEGKFNLSTMELGVDTQVSDLVSSSMVLKYEEDESSVDDDIWIDEVTVTIGNDDSPAQLTVGKMDAPFGAYDDTNLLVSDSLTKADTETAGLRAVMVSTSISNVDVALYSGSGQSNINNDVTGIAMGTEIGGLALGVDYIDNVAESGNSAWTASFGYSMGEVSLFGEHLDRSDAADTKISNIEVAYSFDLAGNESSVMAGFATKDVNDAADTDQSAVAFATSVAEGTTTGVEYMNSDDGTSDTGTVSARIAYEF